MVPLPDHILVRPLSTADLDKILSLEARALPRAECAGRERLAYRLHAAPELSAGMFVRMPAEQHNSGSCGGGTNVDVHACPPSREKLIAYIIGTKTMGVKITDSSLQVPTPVEVLADGAAPEEVDEEDKKPTETDSSSTEDSSTGSESLVDSGGHGAPPVGHVEYGNTIAIDAFTVDPDYRGSKIGTTVLRDYIQRMSTQAVASYVAILAHENMVRFFENLGFYDGGRSDVKFGGGGWHNLYLALADDDEDR
ncbi:uncharacterized protein V1518DRAFT_437113 [Limtongia smithiae]|uniref:uncharacterized protein n=1 Tax=Limtongia smithiae TaxID=1125753 RepID=UPI0034CF668B